uniref:Uncharacterized protein n=1 Tax=Kalanchoe fedtschenkoi TaxID=63787 RepID=A0A7N0VLI9_KALFE
MDSNGGASVEIENADDDFPKPLGRKYRPVVADDRAVLEMAAMESSASSSNK